MNSPRSNQVYAAIVSIALSMICFAQLRAATNSPKVLSKNSSSDEVSFSEQIRPLLNQHCTACHGGVKQAADLSFVYADSMSHVLEPGKAEESEIIRRVIDPDDESRMPPPDHGRRLTQREVDLLRAWINAGAVWQSHWSYEAPSRHPQPTLANQDWVWSPFDSFVLAQLEAKGIRPAPAEQPQRWLRRVSLDLVGLPPSLEAQQLFLSNLSEDSDLAYEQAVDELLSSPHFGERWASVWFDQVRYADSRGLGIDGRRTIWKYRDFVIDALNNDLPYDEFTLKQMAGDLLPKPSLDDYVATAVHRLTQSNEEGGTDDEEFRVMAVIDRVNTVWQTWLGTSFGCAQCHDHPYDPIENRDYYRFMAFFNNTADSDLDDDWPLLKVPKEQSEYDRAGDLQRQIRKLQQEIWQQESELAFEPDQWQSAFNLRVESPQVAMNTRKLPDREEFYTTGTVPMGLTIEVDFPIHPSVKELTAVRLVVRPLNPEKALSDSEWGFVLSNLQAKLSSPEIDKPQTIEFIRVVADDPFPRYRAQESLNAKSNRGFSAFSRIHHPRTGVFILSSPIKVPPQSRLTLTLKHSVSSGGSHPLVIKCGDIAVTPNPLLTRIDSDQELQSLREKLRETRKKLSAIASTTVPVMQERPKHLKRPTHVFERGLFLTKGDQVSPGIPKSLSLADEPLNNRLDLAQWLVAPENPLVARVAVNRFWARLFGTGLVRTEEDFGSTGERPTHPKLLDDLAVRFREDYQWRIKPLLREIVLSSTYRQSAARRPAIEEQDPDNRLLARGPRKQLSAESVRDQALAISGLLDETMFGPPVTPPIAKAVWLPFQGGDKWPQTQRGDSQRYRRSLYTYVKRSIPYPMFATFDAPSREFCVSRRLRSNTPLQPLVTLNHETFVECSEVFATRLLEKEMSVDEQLHLGFALALARPASPSEISSLKSLFAKVSERSDQHTAMTAVAAALMNSDEFLNY